MDRLARRSGCALAFVALTLALAGCSDDTPPETHALDGNGFTMDHGRAFDAGAGAPDATSDIAATAEDGGGDDLVGRSTDAELPLDIGSADADAGGAEDALEVGPDAELPLDIGSADADAGAAEDALEVGPEADAIAEAEADAIAAPEAEADAADAAPEADAADAEPEADAADAAPEADAADAAPDAEADAADAAPEADAADAAPDAEAEADAADAAPDAADAEAEADAGGDADVGPEVSPGCPPGLFCDDGDPCTVNDLCDDLGGCSGTQMDCDDSNACTDDVCVDGACVSAFNDLPCEDGDPCTSGDLCVAGTCAAGAPVDCDDGNICTSDSCDPSGSCLNLDHMGPCDDGDLCTANDTCGGGTCAGVAVVCVAPPPECIDADTSVVYSEPSTCNPGTGDCVFQTAIASCPGQCGAQQAGLCPSAPACPDGTCDAGEDCSSCPGDCGICQASDLTPEADAYAYLTGGSVGSNVGLETEIKFRMTGDRRLYIRFDLTGFSGPVVSATLNLHRSFGAATEFTLYELADDSWQETTITGLNVPPPGPVITTGIAPDEGNWLNVDVTDFVNAELASDPAKRVGMTMYDPNYANIYAKFWSKEYTADPTLIPTLTIVSDSGPLCGDGVCGAGLSCTNCQSDCGVCGAGVCGDTTCDPNEDCASCPGDCGACPCGAGTAQCPDGSCVADGTSCPGTATLTGPNLASLAGSAAWERVQAVDVDAQGSLYLGGSTQSPLFLGLTTGCTLGGSNASANDGWVAKYASDGTLQWARYLCTTSRDDVYGVSLGPNKDLFVIGWTAGSAFPTTAGAFDTTHNSPGVMDMFLTRLSTDDGSILYSTFIGGGGIDQSRDGLFVSPDGVVTLAGYTDSTDFPVTAGAYDTTYNGGYGDVFALRIDPQGNGSSDLLAATFLGSSGGDYAFSGVHVMPDGTVSLGGLAGAANFPTTAGAYQTAYAGDSGSCNPWCGDAFVARLDSKLSSLSWSTFVGGSDDDHANGQHGFTVDAAGQPLIVGSTFSSDFPTTTGPLGAPLPAGQSHFFVSRFSADGANLLASVLIGGTQLASGGYYEGSGVAIGASGRVYISGQMGASDFPLTPDAYQSTYGGGPLDGVITILPSDLSQLDYATFLGGSSGERIRDLWIASDESSLVVVGDTDSPDFPASGLYLGNGDAWFARFGVQ